MTAASAATEAILDSRGISARRYSSAEHTVEGSPASTKSKMASAPASAMVSTSWYRPAPFSLAARTRRPEDFKSRMMILDVVVLPADIEEPIKSTMGVVNAASTALAAQ